MAGIWGNVDDDQPQGGLLAGLQRGVMNPMTLGGLGLLSGEGFGGAMQGMQMGQQFDQQRRQQAEQDRMKAAAQQWYSNPENMKQLPPGMGPLVQAMGEKGIPVAADVLARNYQNPLDTQLKQAQIAKMQHEATDAGATFGKSGNIFQDPTSGKFYSVQFGSNGQKLVEEIGGGLTPSRGVGEVDTGTGTEIIDKATGLPIRNVAKDVRGAASQKTQGEAQGTAVAALPTIESTANRALDTINKIRTHPGKQYGVGVAGVLPGIPGTQQKGFVTLVDQAKGQTFLEAFNSLRGGGAITESEGKKATEAFARLDRAQTAEDFDAALADLEAVIKEGVRVARVKAGGDTLSGRGGQSFVGSGSETPDPLGIR
jgi:hypothetical protein